MTEVFLNKSILPKGQESIDLNSKYLQFSFAIVDNPFYVKKGDPIVELSEKEKLFNCRVIAPYDCVIDRSHLFIYSRGIRTSQSIKEGDLFYKVYTEDEYITSLDSSFKIVEDEITGDKKILWDYVNGENKSFFPLGGFKALLALNVTSGWPTMIFRCDKKYCRLRRKDTVHFLFDEKEVLSYTVLDSKTSSDGWVETTFKLSKDDLAIMQNKAFIKARVDSPREIGSVLFFNERNRLSDKIAQELFKKYACEYEKALDAYGFSWPMTEENSTNLAPSATEESCYVYLMKDVANGFYKIGISNNPEYREHTLQSEKPTIELLAARAFPSRVIASAIESALHTAFGEKRLRGEWFELSEKEVNDIILTLK